MSAEEVLAKLQHLAALEMQLRMLPQQISKLRKNGEEIKRRIAQAEQQEKGAHFQLHFATLSDTDGFDPLAATGEFTQGMVDI